jgi:hypothetical protein
MSWEYDQGVLEAEAARREREAKEAKEEEERYVPEGFTYDKSSGCCAIRTEN